MSCYQILVLIKAIIVIILTLFLVLFMRTILKVFIEFVTLFLFYVLVFGYEACGILASQKGIEPAPTALEGKVLTTRLPGKSPLPFQYEL